MSGSIIRKITRGTSSANGDVTISCYIIDTSKVIVLLDTDCTVVRTYSTNSAINGISGAAGGNVYLKSVSNSNIVVSGYGVTKESVKVASSPTYYSELVVAGPISFSYQIIEFM